MDDRVGRVTGLRLSTASAQLHVLTGAYLIAVRRDGKHQHDRVAHDSVCALIGPFEPINADERRRRIAPGDDVGFPEWRQLGHAIATPAHRHHDLEIR